MVEKEEIAQFKVTLAKSLSGRHKAHQASARSLGLRKIGQTIEVASDPCALGKIRQIKYLLKVCK